MEPTRDRDLILSPTQFALILDEMTGHVSAYVGPLKTSLANNDRPVTYNAATRRFDRGSLEAATQEFLAADEGSYIELLNPASPGQDEHPKLGASSKPPSLQIGRKINVRGPALFPLWPNQTANVIPGQRISSNEYLLARVYNADEARKNLAEMVAKPATTRDSEDQAKIETLGAGDKLARRLSIDASTLTIGQLIVIKGSEISFFIPPTGIELLPEGASFVRKAVTLELLEYCILRDENGKKRYVRGPEVVFPEPTETFVTNDAKSPKFRATELNDDMGLYVKVIADYEDDDSTKHMTGEELFITGKETRIYYPRSEHAVVTYDGQSRIHYGQAIPEGEGRYVLDKRTGKVNMKMGPALFLPDPRYEVIVRRVLDQKTVVLLYPDNAEALAHNQRLLGAPGVQSESADEYGGHRLTAAASASAITESHSINSYAGDDIRRKGTRTPPRTVTLNTKYDGVVTINVWTGYAVLLVDSTGGRRVVVGPQTTHLKYDEVPQVLTLSTGKPKTTDKLFPTAYLRVTNNIVTDIVRVTTSDMVDAMVKVVYRVNFEGAEQLTWFSVENYVKFMCDHTRSKLRGMGRKLGIQEFMDKHVEIIRDALLGKSTEAEKQRPGLAFKENAMRIYDVEILTVDVADQKIAEMLKSTQYNAVASAIKLCDLERELATTKRKEQITRATQQETNLTAIETIDLQTALAKRKTEAMLESLTEELMVTLKRATNELQKAEATWKLDIEADKNRSTLHTAGLERLKAEYAVELEHAQGQLGQRIEELRAQAQTVVEKANAISPQFVAALQAFGDKLMTSEAMKSMSPLAILGGTSVADVLHKLLAGSALQNLLPPAKTNGEGTHRAPETVS